MNGSPLPTLDALKDQAKRLRGALETRGQTTSHSESLELIARQYGFRDWNTLHAAAGNRPALPLYPGCTVSGRYLHQPFTGRVVSMREMGGEHWELAIDFDDPVDVVTFDSFSAFRKRVRVTVDRDGVTAAKTSDGRPHMALKL